MAQKAEYTNYCDIAICDLDAKIFNNASVKAFTYEELGKVIKYKLVYGRNGYNQSAFTIEQLPGLIKAMQYAIDQHKKTIQQFFPPEPKPEPKPTEKTDILASLEIAYKNKWIDKKTYDLQKKALSGNDKAEMSEEDRAQLQAISDMFKNGFMSESKARTEKNKILKKYKM